MFFRQPFLSFLSFQLVHGIAILADAPCTPQRLQLSLSFTDNVPFGNTLRAKATLFSYIIHLRKYKKQAFDKENGIFFLLSRKIEIWALFLSVQSFYSLRFLSSCV